MKNKIFTNTDENKFVREVLPKQSGLFLVKGSIKLDDTHLSPSDETVLVILTASSEWEHSLVICSQGVFFDDVKVGSVEGGVITEEELDTALTAKVNNNVKTVEQTLSNDEIKIASKNLKFRDDNGNFFADKASYADVGGKPYTTIRNSIFGNNCVSNRFNGDCLYNILGNNCHGNTFGIDCRYNTLGNDCNYNILGDSCRSNSLGNGCWSNSLGNFLQLSKLDNGVSNIELKSNANSINRLYRIHILSGVSGKSQSERLVINIPDEYLNSSRELIITTKVTNGGPSTPEDIVMYYADEVVDKQNKQDNTLATTSKEVVGAINELFNGGVKDKSIGVGKLAQAVQDTLGRVGMNIKVLPKGTNLLSADLEDGIWLVTEPNNYTNPPSWFSGNSIALLVVDKTTNNVILIGHDGSSNELPAWASRYLSSTSSWRGAGKDLEEIFAKKYEIVARILPKKSNLYDDTIEEGIYALYADYYAYENFPNGMNRERPALLLRMANMFCIIGADGNTSNPYPFYAWRYAGMSSWSATPLSDRLNEKIDNTSTLTDTEINNIWDNN